MKRIDLLRNISTESLADPIVKGSLVEDGLYCKSNCEAAQSDDNCDCPHPVECCIRWLEEEV